mmetsp:Transcript_48040/g.121087  ORF Transcript_48040/g.121087 Transcript_48040/m.121087 type:complete len:276 (+) Transcript_48040:1711-2538(+)
MREDEGENIGDGFAGTACLRNPGRSGSGRWHWEDAEDDSDSKSLGRGCTKDLDRRLGQGLAQVDLRDETKVGCCKQLQRHHVRPDVHFLDDLRGRQGIFCGRGCLSSARRLGGVQGEGLVAQRRRAWRGLRHDRLRTDAGGRRAVAGETHHPRERAGSEHQCGRRLRGAAEARGERRWHTRVRVHGVHQAHARRLHQPGNNLGGWLHLPHCSSLLQSDAADGSQASHGRRPCLQSCGIAEGAIKLARPRLRRRGGSWEGQDDGNQVRRRPRLHAF